MRAAVARLRARGAAASSTGGSPDDGLGVVEILVAMTVFMVVSAGMLSALTVGFGVAKNNRDRVVASNLASSDLDDVRSISKGTGYDAVSSSTYPKTVGAVRYTVTRTVRPVFQDPNSGPCTGGTGSREVYKKITVRVDWSNRRFSDAARSDTIVRAPGLDVAAGTGSVGVVVTDQANGRPMAGVTATVNGTSRVTEEDGCAYFSLIPQGNYPVTLTAPGYTDVSGTMTQTAGVTANVITKTSFAIQRTARLDASLQFRGANGAPLSTVYTAFPGAFPLTYRSTDGTIAARTLPGLPTAVENLYPADYALYVGNCTKGDLYGVGTYAAVTAAPGSSQSVTVPAAGVSLQPRSGSWGGGSIVAARAADSARGCPAVALTMTAPSNGKAVLNVGLPYGAWTIGYSNRATNVAMSPGADPQTVGI
jgi:hypothetical protein